MTTSSGDLVYLAPHRWDAIMQRPQQLTSALAAQGWRVLHVGPVANSIAGNIRQALSGHRPAWRGQLLRRADRLWTYTPAPGLPLTMDLAALNWLAHERLGRVLRPLLHRLGFDRPLLVVGWPYAGALVSHLSASGVIYDCMDDFGAFRLAPWRQRALVRAEARLVRDAAAVVVTSSALAAKWRARGVNTHLIHNGVADEFLALAAASPAVPDDLACIAPPRLLYSGAIDHWFDTDLLSDILRAHPEWSLVLIGPVSAPRQALSALPNVHFLGSRPHATLPGYLAGTAVGLIPFVRSALTAAVDPVKVYEYLAAGLPVVATDLPELARFADLCAVATDATGFARAIEAALAEPPGDPRRQQRRDRAAAETWQRRARDFSALVRALGLARESDGHDPT